MSTRPNVSSGVCRRVWAFLGMAGVVMVFVICGIFPAHSQAAVAPWSMGPRAASMLDLWQTEQGLPQNHVTSIAQTREGYLWIGTYEGLARFDGVRFVIFHSAQHPDLPSSRITSLHEDAAGTLWIGHEHGQVSSYRHGRFEAVPGPVVSPRGSVIALQSDLRGDLWLLRRSGVVERLRDRLTVPASESAASPVLFAQYRNAQREPGDLWRVQGGRLTRLPETASAPGELPAYPRTNEFVLNACPSGDGSIWVLAGRRLRKWTPGGAEAEVCVTPWGDTPVARMWEGRSSGLWFGTQERGLFCRRPNGEFVHFNRTNGLGSDWVRTLMEDREGTLWVGTGGGGLCALRARRVQMFSPPDDWQGRGLLSVSPGRAGELWVGTEGAGLYRFEGTEVQRFGPADGLSNSYVWTVLDDGPGSAWAGTWGRGLFHRAAGGNWVPVPGLSQDGFVVTALHRVGSGADGLVRESRAAGPLWVGTQRGLARVEGERVDWVVGSEVISPEIRSIAETSDGAVWFGMAGGGLGRWKDGVVRQFGARDGLPAVDVWSLLADGAGLWIGTVGGGLCRWKEGRFATVDARAGLPNNVICQMVDDGQGAIWLGTRGGIVRVSRRELEDCADGRLASPSFFTFGRADGMATLECSGGSQPCAGRTVDGQLLFPTTRGLAVINPADLNTNLVAPPVLMESLSFGGEPGWEAGTNAGPVTVAAGRQRLEFRFTALSFIAPERMRFRYKLEGLEEGWTQISGTRSVSYTRVPPGDYIFRVTACNSDGVWNPSGAALAVTVLPYFWQTWWFQLLVAVAAAGVIGGMARWVTRRRYWRKLDQIERQRAVERERSRIARDIHDDLGASLTRITLLSHSASEELAEPERAAAHLQRISATSLELTKALEEIVWAINPRHDTLDSLVTYLGRFAQDLSSAAGVRCRIDMPTELPPWPLSAESRHNLFLAFKEALHNVVRHAGASQVNVTLRLAPTEFTLAVEDDGRGFPTTSTTSTTTTPREDLGGTFGRTGGAGGNGLQNMVRRLDEIGGRCEVSSVPGVGTTVRLVVKIHDNPAGRGAGKVMS